MINIVIPAAGEGRRFREFGFQKPKPFIDVLGKPMIRHVIDSVNTDNARFILLVRKEHYETEIETVNDIKKTFNAKFILVNKLTEGAACTVLLARKYINNDTPLLIVNSDQIIDVNIDDFIFDAGRRGLDGSIMCFENDSSKWSYAKTDNNGYVTMVREKEVISKNATVGLYYFNEGRIFVENAIDMIVRNDRVNNEFYVAPVYNYAINSGKKTGVFLIDKNVMHGTGTPADLTEYIMFKKEKDIL
jgi:dTDP-glucose pyrophosphorylase